MITGLILQSLACLNAKTLPYLLRYLSMQNSDGAWWCLPVHGGAKEREAAKLNRLASGHPASRGSRWGSFLA